MSSITPAASPSVGSSISRIFGFPVSARRSGGSAAAPAQSPALLSRNFSIAG